MARKIIGLTGAFGSGCTEAAKHLRDSRRFVHVRMSEFVRREWSRRKHRDPGTASRQALQQMGDQLRREKGPAVLAKMALRKCHGKGKLVVVEAFRNLAEIELMRSVLGDRFALVAVVSPTMIRWDRIGTTQYTDKGLRREDFLSDAQRDMVEDLAHGQQVNLCIDKADLVVDNSETLQLFKERVLAHTDLLIGRALRRPTDDEILMNVAYAASHSSKCLGRHVGAVVAGDNGIVAVGYNENPRSTNACADEERYGGRCYRDIVRNERFRLLAARGARCPICQRPMRNVSGPPWHCRCRRSGRVTNLEELFFPDRAMNWCTAIHAEVAAILSAGERARGGSLYTTTFPCFQCCEKITQVGIKRVVFTEAYPDAAGEQRLRLAGIEVVRFDGVRSASFERIFSFNRPT